MVGSLLSGARVVNQRKDGAKVSRLSVQNQSGRKDKVDNITDCLLSCVNREYVR